MNFLSKTNKNKILIECIENSKKQKKLLFSHRDLGAPNAWEMTKDLAAYNDFTAPGVEISCVYGSNVASTER